MIMPGERLRKGDALLILDVQNDFCPGGALAIDGGDEVVPVLNRWIGAAQAQGLPIYLSRDWHPLNHPSFSVAGGDWPVHCLQDSLGAAFHPDLLVPPGVEIISKGVRFDENQLSAFHETGLARQLRRRGVQRLWVGGLALDVCVLLTVLDALREGFAVVVLAQGCRPIDRSGGRQALTDMEHAGAVVLLED
jgi:nicotinamidase/pyrazinamidase